MRYVKVWSLRHGVYEEPEACSVFENRELVREAVLATVERDPPLTDEEMWREQGEEMGSYRRKGAAKREYPTPGSILRLTRNRRIA